ncbi:ERCC4 domain-containing protein [Ferrovum sp.]|uniref:ERCC4 domain-containing protein n=1 Tax=Ferrovum sp. TaxID=2609467 RepID=UPI00261F4E18|nr:ERCC4 domain-containing protein [Ferrovum sp.]
MIDCPRTLVVDSRETNSGVKRRLESLLIPFEQAELTTGDFQIGEFLIERKTAQDFAASILDRRIFGQVENLVSVSTKPVLLIEGDIATVVNNLHPDALPGAISAMLVYYGVRLTHVSDNWGTARLLGRMHKHLNDGLGYEIPLRPEKPAFRPNGALSQYLVEGLPGVGPELARRLLLHFGSARSVFAANVDSLCAVKGVGRKTALSIAEALDSCPTAFRVTKTPPPPTDSY